MLQQLRSSAASIVAKALFLLLIISFGAWGIQGYIFQGQQGDTVATIGDAKISRAELADALRREVNRYRAQGLDITADQARNLGIQDQVLDRLISGRLYEAGGAWLGMGVSDSTVRKVITEEPSFFDESGKFSRSRFEFLLNQSGIPEGQFVLDVRRDVLRRQIINSLDFSDKAPEVLVNALHRWRGEKRVADIAVVPVDAKLDVGEPDPETLAALHEEQAERFTAPERRRLTFLHLTRDAAMKEVVVTEEQLRKHYDENLAAYTEPEKRTVQQMLLDDEETARRAAAMIGEGRTFQAVAKDVAGQDAADLELGAFDANAFPVPELWDAIATLGEGAVSEPKESAFGWHIFRVTGIVAETVTPFETAREAIATELKTELSGEALYKMSTTLEDELAGGSSLEEAAETLNVAVQKTVLIDIGGADAGDKPAEGLPGGNFLDTAFLALSGETSDVVQLPEGDYFLVRVEEIVPSALRPLEDVRDAVADLWKGDKRLEAARSRALAIVERLESGGSLTAIAGPEGLTVSESKPFDRRGGGSESELVTPVLVSDLFRLGLGQAAMDEAPDGLVVAQLKSVLPADPSDTGELATVLGNQMIGDLLGQFSGGLQVRFGVEIDKAALDRF